MAALKAIFNLEALPHSTTNIHDRRGTKQQLKTAEDGRNSAVICLVSTLLFIVCNVVLRVLTAWYVRPTQLHVCFAWIQSVLAVSYLWVKKRRRLRQVLWSIKSSPGVYWYVMFAVITESCCNKLSGNSSGPEIIQLGLVTSPILIVMGTLWMDRKTQPSIVMAFVVIVSLIMTMIVCTIDEPYFPFRITFSNGVVGLFYGISIAHMVLSLKSDLRSEELSIVQQLYSLNLACVIFFPVVIVFTGEWSHLLNKGLPSNLLYVVVTVLILGVVRLLDQVSCLYNIKYTSGLVHTAARGLTWIPISLVNVFTLKMELMIKTLVCFLLMLAVFLTVLVDKLTDINE